MRDIECRYNYHRHYVGNSCPRRKVRRRLWFWGIDSIFIILTISFASSISVADAFHENSTDILVNISKNKIIQEKSLGEEDSPRDTLSSSVSNLLGRVGLKGSLVNVDDDKPHDKTFFGEDPDGNPIVVGTWLQYGSYTLAVAMFGTAFLVACAATAVYYVIFVVTDPNQSRSMSPSSSTILEKLLNSVHIALDLYEKLDNKMSQ